MWRPYLVFYPESAFALLLYFFISGAVRAAAYDHSLCRTDLHEVPLCATAGDTVLHGIYAPCLQIHYTKKKKKGC